MNINIQLKNKINTILSDTFFGKNQWHEKLYLLIYYLAWIFYFLSLIGISTFGYEFFDNAQGYLRIYICIFLIIKFNPYSKIWKTKKVTKFDINIAFHAGLFILTTTIINSFIGKYLEHLGVKLKGI
jgi:hypothetical protein